MDYRVDLHDVKFQLFDWLPTGELLENQHFADWDQENVDMVIDEAAKIAQETIAPTNEDGDRQGAVHQADKVTMPKSFGPAYQTLAEGGWIGCSSNTELGGLGLPELIATVTGEFFSGANLSMSLVNLLTRGTSHLVEDFGGDLAALVCQRMYSGRWTGTMCLTEPQAGSDLGACRSAAEKQDDGTYLLRGEKIFITFGDHDLTENIIHAVLARTPDAPSGTRGLSLFMVPKFRFGPNGEIGEANDVQCASIEHKMGIHGSPTCSMVFGTNNACQAKILGQEGEGMRLMFQMMNAARLEVGVQALGVAGAAQQAALHYAKERKQMRHWDRAAKIDGQVSIIEHPDVRRMLLLSSAYVQAMRAMLLKTSYFVDKAHITEGEEHERYQSYVELLTPVCKAWCSDWGFRVTEWSLQVFGGYGYTRDYPAEQYMRDAKIASIYEGTNGIQALDFVGRKLPARGGAAIRELMAETNRVAEELKGDAELGASAKLLGRALAEFGQILGELPKRDDALVMTLLNAVPLLDMFGTLISAQYLLEQAALAQRGLTALMAERGIESDREDAYRDLLSNNVDATLRHNKIQSAVHFCHRALPGVQAQVVAIQAGEKAPMEAFF